MKKHVYLALLTVGLLNGTTEAYIELRNDEVLARIDRTTGHLIEFVSKQPHAHTFITDNETLQLTAYPEWAAKGIPFDQLQQLEHNTDHVVVVLAPEDATLARKLEARVTYSLHPRGLRVQCEVRHLQDYEGPIELVFGQSSLDDNFWYAQFFPGVSGNMDVLSAEHLELARQEVGAITTRVFQRFGDHPNNALVVPDTFQRKWVRYPYVIMESADRYLLCGRMDVNGYACLAPNYRGQNPNQIIRPAFLEAGETYTFDMNYVFFNKENASFADVCRWYAENVYSSNPTTEGLVTLSADMAPRTLGFPGNVAGIYTPYGYQQHEEGSIRTQRGIFDAFARLAGAVHLWGGLLEWNEIPSLEDAWIDRFGYKITTEDVRREIRSRQADGFREYCYRRQLFPSLAFFEDRPWKQEWMLSTQPDTVFVCPSGPAPLDQIPYGDVMPERLQDYLQSEWGLEIPRRGRDSWIHADFSYPELRDFYVDKVTQWVDRYPEINGLAFDMGWDIHTSPSVDFPDTGTHHGIVNVLARIYQFLEEHHPDKRVMNNMLQGSPSNLYCHGIMFEGGTDLTWHAVQSVKIYRATMIGYYYLYQHRSRYREDAVSTLIYHMMRNLSWGVCLGFGDVHNFYQEPELLAMGPFYRTMAPLTAVPLVVDDQALVIADAENREVSGCVFAFDNRIFVLLFNDTDERRRIDARLQRGALAAPYYAATAEAPVHALCFDAAAQPMENDSVRVEEQGDEIVFSGYLDAKSLAFFSNYPKIEQ